MSFLLRQAEIPILPKGHRKIRVLHLSDLHLTPKRRREIADIQSLTNVQPDLVIVTGDFLAHKDAVATTMDALGELLHLPGLFVFGSNDYFAPQIKNPFSYLSDINSSRTRARKAKVGPELPYEDLRHALTEAGWVDLNHHKRLITVCDTVIEVRGTDDAHLSRDDYAKISGQRDSAAEISIGVTHAPYLRLIDSMARDGVDVLFAGHTHGGQVRLPWFGGSKALTTNCDLPTWRARGLTHLDGEPWLHVSAGMGTSPFARIRVASPPEASLVTLESRSS